jgi:hypothetical protein
LKYLVGWEDQKTGIVYTEPYEDSAPMLEIASRFKKQREAELPNLSIKVKAVTILPSPLNPERTTT